MTNYEQQASKFSTSTTFAALRMRCETGEMHPDYAVNLLNAVEQGEHLVEADREIVERGLAEA